LTFLYNIQPTFILHAPFILYTTYVVFTFFKTFFCINLKINTYASEVQQL